jgi:hypothetical protein
MGTGRQQLVTLPPVQVLGGVASAPQPDASVGPLQHWVVAASVGQVQEVAAPLKLKQQVRLSELLLHPTVSAAMAKARRPMWIPLR